MEQSETHRDVPTARPSGGRDPLLDLGSQVYAAARLAGQSDAAAWETARLVEMRASERGMR